MMLRIMLVNDGSGRAVTLKAQFEQAGIRVVAEIEPGLRLAEMIDAVRPDLVLVDSDAPSRDMLEQVCVTSLRSDLPVVMFTDDNSRDTIRTALRAGVAAYVVGDVPQERIIPVLAVAIERHQLEQARREELNSTRRQLSERKQIEKAKGLLMKMKNLDEATAYKQLRERAMTQQKKLVEVAQEVITLSEWLQS